MDKRTATVLGILFGGLFLLFFAFLVLAWSAMKGGDHEPALASGSGPQIGVVEVRGAITDEEEGPSKSAGGASSGEVIKNLERFRKNDDIKAIVLRIDSPGGAVGTSQEIYEEVRRVAKQKKVVASMGNMAASGGYYIACACDFVMANPGTLTGSIGVISQFFEVKDFLDGWKVHEETIKSGKYKDIGSPFRTWSDEDRAYFQAIIDDVYGQFVQAVADGRKLPVETVRELAQGKVYTGRQAKAVKLVDDLGGLDDALKKAVELAGATGEPRAVYPPRDNPFSLRELLTSAFHGAALGAASGAVEGVRAAAPRGGLQLLWDGAR